MESWLVLSWLSFALLSACGGKPGQPEGGEAGSSGSKPPQAGVPTDADIDADADADAGSYWEDCGCDYTSFEGEANLKSGFSTDPAAMDCDLYWATSGIPTDLCDGCEWAFAVKFTFDASLSQVGSNCFGNGDTDWTWNLGYVPDYYGAFGALYYEYGGDWYPAWLAYFDGNYVYWFGGYYQSPESYEGTNYYYTNYWSGGADLE